MDFYIGTEPMPSEGPKPLTPETVDKLVEAAREICELRAQIEIDQVLEQICTQNKLTDGKHTFETRPTLDLNKLASYLVELEKRLTTN
jgi:hypothetical protein